MADEVYLSVDVEADGPIPGPHSMLSLGAAAYSRGGELLGTFSVNLKPLPGASMHPEQAAFWRDHPEALKATKVDPEEPGAAMARFEEWIGELPGTAVFVGWPAGFDFTFVYWYLRRFLDRSPLSFAALDIKSYAMAMTGLTFGGTVKRRLPARWAGTPRPGHIALNDALMQGEMFCGMLAEQRSRPALRGAVLSRWGDSESGLALRYREGTLRVDLVLPDLSARRSLEVDRDEIVAVAKVVGRVASRPEGNDAVEIADSMRLELARTERAVGLRVKLFDRGGLDGALETRFDLEPKSLGTFAQRLREACIEDERATDPPWM